MGTVPDWLILCVAIVGIIIFIGFVGFSVKQSEFAYTTLYEDLKSFKHFAENCDVTPKNKTLIFDRIKAERARDVAEEKGYRELINELADIYVMRFLYISMLDRKSGETKTQSND
jgi:hypothetical protein